MYKKTEVVISKSDKPDTKLKVVIDGRKTVHFGQKGASDYTKHNDTERKKSYIDRHKTREDWTKSGVETAGYYAKHILWSKPTVEESIKDLNKRFKNLNVKLK